MTAWLPGFKYRRKFTVSSALISETLTNFPVALHAGTSAGISAADLSDIFTELSALDSKRIAVTTSDGVTQCPVEIERFDPSDLKGLFHFKAPTVMAGTDTDFYFYYDAAQHENDSYVGETGSTNGASVWDDNFLIVHHMNSDPTSTIPDSTKNNNDGTSSGSMTSGDLVDNLGSGKGIDFDASNDVINVSSAGTIDNITPMFAGRSGGMQC